MENKIMYFRIVAVCSAVIIVLVIGFGIKAAYCTGVTDGTAAATANAGLTAGNNLSITVECSDWTSDMKPLGVFVSGLSADNAQIDEQLLFKGSSTQALALTAGSYQVTPQYPKIMTPDGAILASDGSQVRWYVSDSGGDEPLLISYHEIDAETIPDEELTEIAAVSFLDPASADAPLAAARLKSADTTASPEPPAEIG